MALMGKLEGKTAIVTGGAHGLGRQVAQDLARDGAAVAILDVADTEVAVAAINAGTGLNTCFGFIADVSDEASVEAAIATIIDRTGRIDILVNNAAVFSTLPPARFAEIDVA